MGRTEIRWDMARLGRLCAKAPETVEAIDEAVSRTAAAATSMSSGNVTGSYHRDHKSPHVGGAAPSYGSDTRVLRESVVGLAYTTNYAAMKDNAKNNTLLKALG